MNRAAGVHNPNRSFAVTLCRIPLSAGMVNPKLHFFPKRHPAASAHLVKFRRGLGALLAPVLLMASATGCIATSAAQNAPEQCATPEVVEPAPAAVPSTRRAPIPGPVLDRPRASQPSPRTNSD